MIHIVFLNNRIYVRVDKFIWWIYNKLVIKLSIGYIKGKPHDIVRVIDLPSNLIKLFLGNIKFINISISCDLFLNKQGMKLII